MLKLKKLWRIISLFFYIGVLAYVIYYNVPIKTLLVLYISFFVITKIIFIGDTIGSIGIFSHIVNRNEEKANKYYKLAYKHNTTNFNVLASMSLIMLKEGQIEEAKKMYEELLRRPRLRTSYKKIFTANLGICYWKLGDLEKALEYYQCILDTEEFSNLLLSDDYTTLGYICLELGDFKNAEYYTDIALRLDDENVSAIDNMGQLYYRKEDFSEAKKYFEKACKIKPNTVDSNYWLGKIYKEEEKNSLAKTHFKNALDGNITALNTVTKEEIENELRMI
ncbi:Tfp pilus assembly protein PilF [Natranaerovirga pectinivora]|uniref:Tfp pilus assembly protein PilF n=1 Tax=Natranaerovirga pectinivora TaxID=682400 RepID=A0A4R3MQJ1_9FIRM|nr:tetratricopeptide repeat protein [Natranaerovirga pectinivora]TCT14690.1 Tfp pilus assembly protein PilF [Natranaerovirga pectinivora]